MIELNITDKKSRYYRKYAQEIRCIFQILNEIQQYGEEYYDYIASIKAVIPDDFAESIDYDSYTFSELEQNYLALQDLELEASDVLHQARKEEERKKNLEIGNASIAFLGTDSLTDLDEVLRKNREEKEQQKKDAIQSVTKAVSAIHGNGDVLASLFKSENTIQQIKKDDEDTSESKGNPKGE